VTRAGVISTIDTRLSAVSSPAFSAVYVGEPLSIAGTPACAFWLSGVSQDFTTLGDASTVADFTIRAYWRMQTSADIREDIELDIWNAVSGILSGLRGDAALGGNCTDSDPGDATTGYLELGGVLYRQATIPFSVDLFGSETITP